MEIFKVTFIGHRKIYGFKDLEDRLEEIISELIKKHEYVEFYVGRNGDFDISVASSVKRAQKKLDTSNSSLILVLPYRMRDEVYYAKFYNEIYNPNPRRTYPKAAITKRNRWMIENADLLIAFVEEGKCGGALTAHSYAKRLGKPIINLLDIEENPE